MSEIKIIKEPISRADLKKIAEERFGDLVKAAVDVEQEIMAVGGEFHMEEQVLLYKEAGSKQHNVWGINIKPDERGNEFIEFDSLINIKPNQNNRTRGVEDTIVKGKIVEIVNKLVHD